MDMLMSIVAYIGVVVVSLVLVLFPMRWVANKFGAGRTGLLYCFLALVVPYILVAVVMGGAVFGLTIAGITPDALMLGGLVLLSLILGFFVYIRILDASWLRGLGIAVSTTIVSWLLLAVLGAGVAILGVGGASVAALAGLLDDPGMLLSGEAGVATPAAASGATRAGKAETKEVRALRKAVKRYCGCVEGGGECLTPQAKLTKLMEDVDPDKLPGQESEIAMDLQMQGLDCLASAMTEESSTPVTVEASAGSPAPAPMPAAKPQTTPSAAQKLMPESLAVVVAKAYAASASSNGSYGYREMSAEELTSHVGKLVRITMTGGEERADIVVNVESDVIVLRQGRAKGGRSYELPRDGIARIRVLGRW